MDSEGSVGQRLAYQAAMQPHPNISQQQGQAHQQQSHVAAAARRPGLGLMHLPVTALDAKSLAVFFAYRSRGSRFESPGGKRQNSSRSFGLSRAALGTFRFAFVDRHDDSHFGGPPPVPHRVIAKATSLAGQELLGSLGLGGVLGPAPAMDYRDNKRNAMSL